MDETLFCHHDGGQCVVACREKVKAIMNVSLVFTKNGELVACLSGEPRRPATEEELVEDCVAGIGMEHHIYDGPEFERVQAAMSIELACKLVEKLDGDLTRARYDAAWRLAEKYLANYSCTATGAKLITPTGRVLLETKCVNSDDACTGVFECQFGLRSSRVLSCAILVGDRLSAQIYPLEKEYQSA